MIYFIPSNLKVPFLTHQAQKHSQSINHVQKHSQSTSSPIIVNPNHTQRHRGTGALHRLWRRQPLALFSQSTITFLPPPEHDFFAQAPTPSVVGSSPRSGVAFLFPQASPSIGARLLQASSSSLRYVVRLGVHLTTTDVEAMPNDLRRMPYDLLARRDRHPGKSSASTLWCHLGDALKI
jgi:hypothetical protein